MISYLPNTTYLRVTNQLKFPPTITHISDNLQQCFADLVNSEHQWGESIGLRKVDYWLISDVDDSHTLFILATNFQIIQTSQAHC